MPDTVFILGSPRSGTTLLGDILDMHPAIARWYEPFFITDHFFRYAPDDTRTAADATLEVSRYIRQAFDNYRRKRGSRIVLDKSPPNSLKVPFLHAVFPDARFVHIVRDGRDVTLSINKEWRKRSSTLSGRTPFKAIEPIKRRMWDGQPLMAHRLAALRHETGKLWQLPSRKDLLQTIRWDGRIGWGPRFEDWRDVIDTMSVLEFNALQWRACTESVIAAGAVLPDMPLLEVRYETLLSHPTETLARLFDYMEIEFPAGFSDSLPELNTANTDKWRRAFSDDEQACVGKLLNPLLKQLGYPVDND